MRKLIIGCALSIAAAALSASVCHAGFSEVRLGVLAHDPLNQKEEGVDLNVQLYFDSWTSGSWELRPTIGGTVNVSGDTSQGYIGIVYGGPISDSLFVEIGGGGAIHDGKLETAELDRKELGSRILFHVEASIGVMLTDTMSLSLYADHISNAGIEERNEGLETAGLRIGFSL
jgi:lipid A 3-O-deacylase